MLPYKTVVDRLRESEKVTSRINVAVHRYGREIDVCDKANVNDTNLVYHIFGQFTNKSAKRVKGDLEGYILQEYDNVVPLIKSFIQPLKLDHYSYITRITQDNVRPDAMCIYLLSKMCGKHSAIVTENRVWFTFEGDGGVADCDMVLVFKGANVFVNTKVQQKRWKKPDTQSNLIFEAGEQVRDEEGNDPDYKPQGRSSKPKLFKRKRGQQSSRKAARRAGHRVRSSYYDDPDYVINVSDEKESSESDVELVAEHNITKSKVKRRKALPSKRTEERVIGTVHILEYGSSTEEYDLSQYSLDQGITASTAQVKVKSVPSSSAKKTVPAKTFSIKKKARTSVKCLICRELFPNYSACNAHVISKHGKEFKCSRCHKKFKARRYLLKHIKRHDQQQLQHVCEQCGKRFLHPSDLKEHSTVHSDKARYHCNWLGCDRKFKFKKDLNKHFIRAHTTTPDFQCPYCVQTFDDKRLYTQHLRTHAEPTIPCSRCGKLFRHYATRNKHMRYCNHAIVE